MKMLSCACAAVLFFSGLASAQSPLIGNCPDTAFQDNFDATKYFVGKWYEQRRFFAVFEVGQKCVEAEYEILPTGYVQVNNSGFVISQGNRVNQVGSAYCEKDQPAYCHVRFFESMPWGDYKVLSTDYETYSVVYSCRSLFGSSGFNTQFGWVLTRESQPDASVIQNALNIFQKNGVDTSNMEVVVQDCN